MIYRSTDGGRRWEQVLPPGPARVWQPSLIDGTRWRLILGRTVLATDNAGRTWRTVRADRTLTVTNDPNALPAQTTFTTSKVAWFVRGVEAESAWRSTDGGATWQPVALPAARTQPPPTSEGQVATTAACAGGDLTFELAKRNPGNANQPSAYISIRNKGSIPCELDGYPVVRPVIVHGASVRIHHGGSYEIPDPGAAPVRLRTGQDVLFGVGWIQTMQPPCATMDALRVATGAGRRLTTVPLWMEACGTPPVIDVTAIRSAAAFSGGAPPP